MIHFITLKSIIFLQTNKIHLNQYHNKLKIYYTNMILIVVFILTVTINQLKKYCCV